MPNAVSTDQMYKPKWDMKFGIAAADKEFHSRKLRVYLNEVLPFHTDKLEATEIVNTVKTSDNNAGTYEGETTTKNYIEAEYMDLFSNRVHPPDVRRGEQVILVNMEDSDTYFWYSAGRDDNLRRTERMRLAVSDDVAFQKELDDDNTWYIEFDTLHNKKLVISTANSDTSHPVKYRYRIEIDADKDTLFICDNNNNEIRINSDIPQIYLRNKDNSIVDINKKNIVIAAPEDIILKAGRQIVRDAPIETNQNTKGDGTTVMKANNLTIECANTMTVKSPSIGMSGQTTVDGSLRSQAMQATGYSTGSPSAYGHASTDLNSGGGAGGNSPNEVTADPGNRHCAAYENLVATVAAIVADLEKIDSVTGYGNNGGGITALAMSTIMPKNKGE